MGLTNQETQLAYAYKSLPEIDALVVTGENEQYTGCFSLLKQIGISNQIITGFDEHKAFKRLVKEFMTVVSDFKPDVVTVNTNWQLLIAGVAKFVAHEKFKLVYTIHGFRHNSPFKSVIARYLIGFLLLVFADKVNAPTVYVASKFSFLRRRLVSIPLGEDNIFFDKSAPPDFSSPLNFVFPGVFRQGKNQKMLIEAFAIYFQQSDNLQGKLYLPGEGEFRSAVMNFAKSLGISDRVVFPGQLNRQEMLDIYSMCQVAVIPTNSETFGHCIAEPLVMQRIVISRHVGLAPDYLVHGVNGFLFNGKEQLVQCLLRIDSMSQAERISMSKAACRTGENFRWITIANRHLSEFFTG
jgi:glycosyltransferase involved in cell wall biosynthesis